MSKVIKKWLNTTWPCKRPEKGRPNIYVGVTEDNKIKIGVFLDSNTPDGFAFFIDRRMAKLLAKRIIQCLAATWR